MKHLFSGVNGYFFEKQIIFDILVEKIREENKTNSNFKELNVHSIYCMDANIKAINFNNYKDKNILITQESKTGEIYDFAIIIGNNIKLYQVSTKKPVNDFLRLNRILIEIDCKYMQKEIKKNIR